MALDWHKPLETADGRYGVLLPPDGLTEKRRVHIARDGSRFDKLDEAKAGTTWLYNEDGTLDASPAGSSLVNTAVRGFRAAA